MLRVKIKFDKEAGIFVSSCPGLGIFSQGKSEEKAKLALEDAIHSFFDVAYKNNLLGRFFNIC